MENLPVYYQNANVSPSKTVVNVVVTYYTHFTYGYNYINIKKTTIKLNTALKIEF